MYHVGQAVKIIKTTLQDTSHRFHWLALGSSGVIKHISQDDSYEVSGLTDKGTPRTQTLYSEHIRPLVFSHVTNKLASSLLSKEE